eukprot:355744-Chlamydomonas_euryale.AAC.9
MSRENACCLLISPPSAHGTNSGSAGQIWNSERDKWDVPRAVPHVPLGTQSRIAHETVNLSTCPTWDSVSLHAQILQGRTLCLCCQLSKVYPLHGRSAWRPLGNVPKFPPPATGHGLEGAHRDA